MKSGDNPHVFLFLDANVLISAARKENAEVAGIWRLKAVTLITSAYVMDEVQRNLLQVDQIGRLRRLMTAVQIFKLGDAEDPVEALSLPLKDRPVLAAAVEARSDYLVTGDKKHFGQWFGQTISGVRIEPPTNLLTILRIRNV